MKAIAYIDDANLHRGVQSLGWQLNYAGLVSFLKEKGKFQALISPSNNCSFLLRKLNISIVYLDSKRNILRKR